MFSKIFNIRLLLNILLLLIFQKFATAIVPANESTIILYYGPELTSSMEYNLSNVNEVLQNPNFNKIETHFYMHGYNESQNSPSVRFIVGSYSKRTDINLLSLNWSKAAAKDYIAAATMNIELLAPVLADSITSLYNAGLDRKSLTIVAHSLGAQLAGMAARIIMQRTNGNMKIDKMAALDAAFPLFDPSPPFLPALNKNDVGFLQAIHTSSGTYGQPITYGHVDFWPNGGTPKQPGCPQGVAAPLTQDDLCSHFRSWRFWGESVANVNGSNPKFIGFRSSSYVQFLIDGANNLKKEPVEMGFNCSISSRGNIYLKTNSQSLFAKGLAGY